MKTKKENVSLDEQIDRISNDLMFHPHPMVENMFMDHAAVSALLEIHPRTLRKYSSRGLIKSQRIEKCMVYKLLDVELLAKYIALKNISSGTSDKLYIIS